MCKQLAISGSERRTPILGKTKPTLFSVKLMGIQDGCNRTAESLKK
jgi:hypothetical protein